MQYRLYFSLLLLMIAPPTFGSLDIIDNETTSGVGKETSHVPVSLEIDDNNSHTELPLLITVKNTQTGMIQDLLPGDYLFDEGNYELTVYRSNPHQNKPLESYQFIEDRFRVANGSPVTRKYQAPIRRKKVDNTQMITISTIGSYISSLYPVPNGRYAYLKKYTPQHLGNEQTAGQLLDIPGSPQTMTGVGVQYTTNIVAGYPYIMELEGSLNYSTGGYILNRSLIGMSVGSTVSVMGVQFMGTFGYQVEKIQWLNLAIKGELGSVDVDHSLHLFSPFLKFAMTPNKGGLYAGATYQFYKNYVAGYLGWNWGGTRQAYDIEKSARFK